MIRLSRGSWCWSVYNTAKRWQRYICICRGVKCFFYVAMLRQFQLLWFQRPLLLYNSFQNDHKQINQSSLSQLSWPRCVSQFSNTAQYSAFLRTHSQPTLITTVEESSSLDSVLSQSFSIVAWVDRIVYVHVLVTAPGLPLLHLVAATRSKQDIFFISTY